MEVLVRAGDAVAGEGEGGSRRVHVPGGGRVDGDEFHLVVEDGDADFLHLGLRLDGFALLALGAAGGYGQPGDVAEAGTPGELGLVETRL